MKANLCDKCLSTGENGGTLTAASYTWGIKGHRTKLHLCAEHLRSIKVETAGRTMDEVSDYILDMALAAENSINRRLRAQGCR